MERSESESIRAAADALIGKTWISFAELGQISGLSRDDLMRHKQEIEGLLKVQDPDVFLTSRIDLDPEGFELNY